MTDRNLSERLRDGAGHCPEDVLTAEWLMDEAADALDAKDALLAEAEKALELAEEYLEQWADEPECGHLHEIVQSILAKIKARHA